MTSVAIATFDDEAPFLRARTRANAEERRIIGEWAPYAPESLGGSAGEKGVRASVVIGGFAGGIGLFLLESWSAAIAYPINSGGRALWSWQAFLPAAVEFSALAGAIVGIVILFYKAGLTRLNHPAFDIDEVARASQDSFVLALGCDEGDDANAALALLASAGATHSRIFAR